MANLVWCQIKVAKDRIIELWNPKSRWDFNRILPHVGFVFSCAVIFRGYLLSISVQQWIKILLLAALNFLFWCSTHPFTELGELSASREALIMFWGASFLSPCRRASSLVSISSTSFAGNCLLLVLDGVSSSRLSARVIRRIKKQH